MVPARETKRLCLVAGTAILIGGGALLALFLSPSFSLLRGRADRLEDSLIPGRKTMSFRVDAPGVLRATSVQNFSAPPMFGEYWRFQIVDMVAEGKEVKPGDMLLRFDAQKIQNDLLGYRNELDQAVKEMEKTEAQIELEQQEWKARLAETENRYAKLKLKQEGVSAELLSVRDRELDRLAREQALREVEALKERIEWHRKSAIAGLNIIASKKARAENKVNEILRGMEGFKVNSDRVGVVVYKQRWNGERFRVGENCWSGLSILEIPDLKTIVADAFVPEVDMSRIRVGQRADVVMDAFPGRLYSGVVRRIGTLVRPKSYDSKMRILEVQIALDQLDTAIMRPAMSVRARIETQRVSDIVAVPLESVRTVPGATVVQVWGETGWTDRPVLLGEANGAEVVVRSGLRGEERIARRYMPWKKQ